MYNFLKPFPSGVLLTGACPPNWQDFSLGGTSQAFHLSYQACKELLSYTVIVCYISLCIGALV